MWEPDSPSTAPGLPGTETPLGTPELPGGAQKAEGVYVEEEDRVITGVAVGSAGTSVCEQHLHHAEQVIEGDQVRQAGRPCCSTAPPAMLQG